MNEKILLLIFLLPTRSLTHAVSLHDGHVNAEEVFEGLPGDRRGCAPKGTTPVDT